MCQDIGAAILRYDVVSWVCQNWCTKELIIIALLQKCVKTLVLQYSDMMWSHGFIKTVGIVISHQYTAHHKLVLNPQCHHNTWVFRRIDQEHLSWLSDLDVKSLHKSPVRHTSGKTGVQMHRDMM